MAVFINLLIYILTKKDELSCLVRWERSLAFLYWAILLDFVVVGMPNPPNLLYLSCTVRMFVWLHFPTKFKLKNYELPIILSLHDLFRPEKIMPNSLINLGTLGQGILKYLKDYLNKTKHKSLSILFPFLDLVWQFGKYLGGWCVAPILSYAPAQRRSIKNKQRQ